MLSNLRQALVLVTAGLAIYAAGPAAAQPYPSKLITIVVPFPAGSDTDAMARLYGEKLSTRVGQPVIIDNRPGASGTIGAAFVAKAPADGYTLLMTPSTFSIAQLVLKTGNSSAYDETQSFTPIIMTSVLPLFIAVNSTLGVKDVKELVAMSKVKPLTYASPSSGSPMHILGELFNKSANVQNAHVPYRGVTQAVNDVLGGHVPFTFVSYGPVAPHLLGGKLNLLAVADPQRSVLAPSVPTLAELGFKDVNVGAWQGIFGPKGMPADVVKTLNTQFNDILKMPEVVSKMATLGGLPAGGEPSRLAKVNSQDHARFGKIIKELGIRAD